MKRKIKAGVLKFDRYFGRYYCTDRKMLLASAAMTFVMWGFVLILAAEIMFGWHF